MKIKNRYFSAETPHLIDALNEFNIPYKTYIHPEGRYIVYYMFDDDIRKEEIEKNQSFADMKMSEFVFSKKEYKNAEWYRFIPTCHKIPSCDNDITFSYFCNTKDGDVYYKSNHKHQCGYYCINQRLRLGNNKCIYSSEGIADQYWFVNKITRDMMEKADIHGVNFEPVLFEKTMNPIDNIYQIVFGNTIPEDAVLIGKEWGIRCVLECPGCGERRFYPMNSNAYQLCLKKKYIGTMDIYVTQAWFGSGYGMHMVVGSKKLYRFIIDNKLNRYFKIHPVLTV